MTFSSYMEVNILIDLVLIGILSVVVLPRAPRFFFAFLLLNLSQYAFIIPLNPASGEARLVWSEPAETVPETEATSASIRDAGEDSSTPARNPMQLIGRASEGFAAVTGALGGKTAGVSREEIQKTIRSEMGLTEPPNPEESASRRVSLSPQQVMVDALRDPEAMWLGMRFFWLAACFMLFIQRPHIGAAAACANLIPVPFLARGIPYLTHQYRNNQAIQEADARLRDPETLAEWAHAFWSSHGIWVLVLTGLVLLVLVVALVRRERRNARDTQTLRSQLEPEQFWIDLNGGFHEFHLEGQELVVGDLRFPLNQVAAERGKQGFWRLGGRTVVRFVSKSEPREPLPHSRVTYSYKRKK